MSPSICKWNLEFGIIRSTLSPSCVASTLHHQNCTLCPKLRITKKFILPTRKVLENQFSKLKSKKPYFWQCSCTVVLKSRIFCVRPNIGPYDLTIYQKAVCYSQSRTLGNTGADSLYEYKCTRTVSLSPWLLWPFVWVSLKSVIESRLSSERVNSLYRRLEGLSAFLGSLISCLCYLSDCLNFNLTDKVNRQFVW